MLTTKTIKPHPSSKKNKLKANKVDLECVDVDIRRIVESVVGLSSPHAAKKKVELSCFVAFDIDTVKGDSTRIRQICMNLISNAIKFTDRGFVHFEVRIDREDCDHVTLHFSCKDTGVGIKKNQMGLLFKAFSQAEGAATTRKFGGSGMGLSIVSMV